MAVSIHFDNGDGDIDGNSELNIDSFQGDSSGGGAQGKQSSEARQQQTTVHCTTDCSIFVVSKLEFTLNLRAILIDGLKGS